MLLKSAEEVAEEGASELRVRGKQELLRLLAAEGGGEDGSRSLRNLGGGGGEDGAEALEDPELEQGLMELLELGKRKEDPFYDLLFHPLMLLVLAGAEEVSNEAKVLEEDEERRTSPGPERLLPLQPRQHPIMQDVRMVGVGVLVALEVGGKLALLLAEDGEVGARKLEELTAAHGDGGGGTRIAEEEVGDAETVLRAEDGDLLHLGAILLRHQHSHLP
mmetsp:Transcript_21320/g.48145  ORF Transcript_21320/g.48145 Transcript_21320/m.48145 type:complete len:219 (-) Transcript_21320:2863-3519(-)